MQPKIRFKGFSGDCSVAILKEITILVKDGTHGSHLDGNDAYLLSAKNIKNGRILIDKFKDRKISIEDYEAIYKNYHIQPLDLLLTIVGTIGDTALYKDVGERVSFQRSVAIIRFQDSIYPVFIQAIFNSANVSKQLKLSSSMSAQAGVYLNDLEKIKLVLPCKNEQIKIGSFFQQLDNTIVLHEQKHTQTLNIKKAMLEKMFPKAGCKQPEIRFKGFSGDWVLKTLGEVSVEPEYGLNASAIKFDGKHKYIRITDIDDETRKFLQNDLTSPDVDIGNADKYVLTKGNILFARTGASVGKTYIYDENDGLVYFAGFLIRFKVKKYFDERFIFTNTLTTRFNNFVKLMSQRSGQPGINAKEYEKFDFYCPFSPEEQIKIGNYFKQLDDTLALQAQQLKKLKNIKQACLEKMFV